MVHLAIDIGASSGRHIVGWRENGELQTKEVYRFPNGVQEENGHLVWDVGALLHHVKEGIRVAKEAYPNIKSLSIDTWGVDYVLFNGEKEILPAYAYRDSRMDAVISKVHEIMPFDRLYRRTGCQFQPFNTLYQLYCDKLAGRLEGVTDLLMMPEYLLYKLCGNKAREYTNATTTGMINAQTGAFDEEIIETLGYPKQLFPALCQPGTVIGEYEGIQCVLCATHDTASAVEGIPMEGNHLYISSGTWSLLGVKTPKPITDEASEQANYSNEGGVGYNRYQKNIMGMWLVNELQRELCPDTSFTEIVRMAQESACEVLVDANATEFLSPKSMKAAFDKATGNGLRTVGDYFRCAYRSLGMSYKKAIEELEHNTGSSYEKLYIVGGGAKNTFLNELTQQATGKQVIALPIEATALGNLKIQMQTCVCKRENYDMKFDVNEPRMQEFIHMSQIAGSRADYVQGGGGNTSVKLENGLMAIKASGFCLKDITKDNGYAVLNGAALRKFYREHNPKDFADCEGAGAQCTKNSIQSVEGIPQLRPSVEAGFHSVLKTYVLHTHSVYGNLAACAVNGKQIAEKALKDAPYSWGWVDYQDPGATLAFAIRDEMDRVERETGKVPAVILMQNHGIIVHDDDAISCLAIHSDANTRLAAQFGLAENAFPAVTVKELPGGVYEATTPYLKERLRNCAYTQEQLLTQPLYPDQMVFLVDTYFQDREDIENGQAVSDNMTGEMVLRMSKQKAQALTETLTAVFFIMEQIQRAGYQVSTMSDAARNFIANWESEKYRKSLNEKK